MKLILIPFTLLLASCGENIKSFPVTPVAYELAKKVCDPNGGILQLTLTSRIYDCQPRCLNQSVVNASCTNGLTASIDLK